MSELQPYVAKVDSWVNYYSNADKKKQNVSIGGSMGGDASDPAPHIESKPHHTVSAPTSTSVTDTISPTQAIVEQSISNLKRKRKGGHKKGRTKKRKTVKGKKKRRKTSKGKARTKKLKRNKGSSTHKKKKKKKKNNKKNKKRKTNSGIKKKGSLRGLIKKRLKGNTGHKKKR